MHIAVSMLANGSQTEDVEASIASVVNAFGVRGVQAAVSFSMISISHSERPDVPPTTLLHLVRGRTIDFSRMTAVADVVRRIRSGALDLDSAEQEVHRLDEMRPPYTALVAFAAPGLSAAASTLMFGGDLWEAAATLAIGLGVQPLLIALNRSALPPFFRLATGAAVSAILVALFVGLGLEITGGLVLAGSLLRFLPGYALVSGFRDLIDGSVVSGTARLAEAILLGAAVAGGTALSLAVASSLGVSLHILTVGEEAWGLAVSVGAALVAVAAYAVQLGVPARAVGQAAAIGAVGWLVSRAATPLPVGQVDAGVATFGATIFIGILGRIFTRRSGAPPALLVVPAILPLLPGLQLVQAMLAETDAARINGLLGAIGTAFVIGTGVALGDILVLAVRGVRDQVVAPAFGAFAGGVDVLIIEPVGRVVGRARHSERAAPSNVSAGDAGPDEGPSSGSA